VKRKILIPISAQEPEEPEDSPPPMSMTILQSRMDDGECTIHGPKRRVVISEYVFTDGKGTPYRPETATQCLDCFYGALRRSSQAAEKRHAMWENGWEIPCDTCRKDGDLAVMEIQFLLRDGDGGRMEHTDLLMCRECYTRHSMGLASLHDLYMKELDE